MVRPIGHNLMSNQLTNAEVNRRILFVGDPGVGKSSLIYSLTNIEPVQKVPAKISDVIIPADILPNHVPITISDFSLRDPGQETIQSAVEKATIICIVYISGCQDSVSKVAKYWIPTVSKIDNSDPKLKPIILVANKIDLIENESLSGNLRAIQQEFVNVEGFIEVSALERTNIDDIFLSTHEAIIHPLAPLYEPKTRQLTTKCRKALENIFQLVDLDKDGLINNSELEQFQESCFGSPLQPDAVEELMQVVKQSTIDGVVKNSFTLEGFLFIHALSIDKGKRHFTWQVLRKFNYDDQLNLRTRKIKGDEGQSVSTDHMQNLIDKTKKYHRLEPESQSSNLELISPVDLPPWVRTNIRAIRAGLSLTVTTFVSFLALKYLTRGLYRG